MRYLGAVIWNAIPINTKTVTPFNSFKNRIKSECHVDSKIILQGVGFIDITE